MKLRVSKWILLGCSAAVALNLSSCATPADDWRLSDPNKSANIAAELTDPRQYSGLDFGDGRGPLTQEELRALAKPKEKNKPKFSGSFGVSYGTFW